MGFLIDVSKWQGDIDWPTAAPSVDLAILRASCGGTADVRVAEYAAGCRENGVPFGVYHYFMAKSSYRAVLEAETFYQTAAPLHPRFWVLDVEEGGVIWANGKALPMKADLAEVTRAFVERLRALGAERLGFYGGESVLSLGKLDALGWDFLWFANYVAEPKAYCDLHQYTSAGSIPGIRTRVDLNRLCGDKPLEWFTGQPICPPTEKRVRVLRPTAWHLRAGNGPEFPSLGYARKGDSFPYVATAVNDWLAVRYDTQIAWLSPKCAEIVED